MSEAVTADTANNPTQTGATPPVSANTPNPDAPKPGEKIYTIKYPDGRVEQRGESWVQERAQKSIGLESRVAAADKYEQAFNTFVAKVQDPSELLKLLEHPDLKYDDDKQEALIRAMLSSKRPRNVQAAKDWLYENEVKPSMMDPKDRELMEVKSEAEALKQEKLERQRLEKETEETQKVAQIKEAFRIELVDAYRESGLPIDDFLVSQVMRKAKLYTDHGKRPDFKNCCKIVQNEFVEQCKSVLGKANVDNILTLMDGETAKTINKALMKAVDKKDEAPVISGEPRTPKAKQQKQRDPKEVKKWLRDLQYGQQ